MILDVMYKWLLLPYGSVEKKHQYIQNLKVKVPGST